MKTKKYVATLAQVGEVIHGIDLTRLENRLVGKPLIEMEHCLIEILGYLSEDHQHFKKFIAKLERDCINTSTRDEFMSFHAEYSSEKSHFGTKRNLGSPIGFYFRALNDRLIQIEDKQEAAGKTVTVCNARILAALIVREIEMMWATSQHTDEKVERLWNHYVFEQRV